MGSLATKIRNWCALMPAGATLTNCYKARKGDRDGAEQWAVPQSFSFMAREGLEGFGILIWLKLVQGFR